MFTGLIRDIGEIMGFSRKGDDVRLRIATHLPFEAYDIAASVACSGICLTVIERGEGWFDVEASAETLSKTTLGTWEAGTQINLEPSLRMGDDLGGHLVFGHVDGQATL
ncbi:MAG: riboflavin synthase, partial [Pseudobdellovibrionaceae bacterium]